MLVLSIITALVSCSFETDCDAFNQDSSDVFDWVYNQGKTESDYTGPSYDHTLKNSKGRLPRPFNRVKMSAYI